MIKLNGGSEFDPKSKILALRIRHSKICYSVFPNIQNLDTANDTPMHNLLVDWWTNRNMPIEVLQARIVLIFKKGDPSLCDNYRPISLISVGYKVFATVLLERLRAAGAEERLWKTQFGF